MKGTKEIPGIIPLCLKYIFDEKFNVNIKICYIEIYNETINDLINIKNKNLKITSKNNKINLQNIEEILVKNYDEAIKIL